jgi:hypothetical protein
MLVVGAASWSDPDLAALDRLAQHTRNRDVHVGVPNPKATPFVLQYKRGALTYAGDGHEATLWLDQI